MYCSLCYRYDYNRERNGLVYARSSTAIESYTQEELCVFFLVAGRQVLSLHLLYL